MRVAVRDFWAPSALQLNPYPLGPKALMTIAARQLTTIAELVQAAFDLYDKYGFEVWWRGQSKNMWVLTPRVFRSDYGAQYEQQVAARFKRAAGTRHPKCPGQLDLAAWLYMAQHYGLPTRLLDWTESPLVALFFVVREQSDCAGTLWALAPYELNRLSISEAMVLNSHDLRAAAHIEAAFDIAKPSPKNIVATYPEEIDIRLSLQLSAFTLHGIPSPLEEMPGSERFLAKYTIPATAKAQLRLGLDALGLRRANVFPDLENLAAQLAELRF